MTNSDPTASKPMRYLPVFMGVLILVIACSSLIGWTLQNEMLIRVSHDWMAMNPMTATCFLSLVVAFFLFIHPKTSSDTPESRNPIAVALIFLVVAIASIRLFDYIFHWGTGIDRILFEKRMATTNTDLTNSMAPNTAFSFLLASSSLLFMNAPYRRWLVLSQGATLWMVLTGFVTLIGYSVDAPGLYQPLPFIGMAAHTALCFILLGVATLAWRSDRGFAKTVLSNYLGGAMARRILPLALVLPLTLGWSRLFGQRMGLYDMEFGLGMVMVGCVITFIIITLFTAKSLNSMDRDRRRIEEEVKVTAQRLAHALDISGTAIVSIDEDEKVVFFDDSARKLFGFEAKEILGRDLKVVLPDLPVNHSALTNGNGMGSQNRPEPIGRRDELIGVRKNGGEFSAEAVISQANLDGHKLRTVVVRDVSERKRIEEEILHRERLAAANEELESFSYSVSHDLRAPLRHIDGFVDLLRKRVKDDLDEKSQYYLSTIADSAKQMGTLIDDLLSFSRMTRAEMSKTDTDLRSLIDQVIQDASKGMKERKIEWKIDDFPQQECDPAMIKQVYFNLVGNALKFTRDRVPAEIEIGFSESESDETKRVYFVRDNGVGFDMSYREKLFGVFQRLHRQEDFEGTGIGLANVRRIVRRHGGDAWGEGEPDKGAVFFFSLPTRMGDLV